MIMQWNIALDKHVQSLPGETEGACRKAICFSHPSSPPLFLSLSLLEVHGKLPVRPLCMFAGGRCYIFFSGKGGKITLRNTKIVLFLFYKPMII